MQNSIWFKLGAAALAVGILVIGWRIGKKHPGPIEDEELHKAH